MFNFWAYFTGYLTSSGKEVKNIDNEENMTVRKWHRGEKGQCHNLSAYSETVSKALFP
jgi:hypothetical protein